MRFVSLAEFQAAKTCVLPLISCLKIRAFISPQTQAIRAARCCLIRLRRPSRTTGSVFVVSLFQLMQAQGSWSLVFSYRKRELVILCQLITIYIAYVVFIYFYGHGLIRLKGLSAPHHRAGCSKRASITTRGRRNLKHSGAVPNSSYTSYRKAERVNTTFIIITVVCWASSTTTRTVRFYLFAESDR